MLNPLRMQRRSCLAQAIAIALGLALTTLPAGAQPVNGSETLETPYSDTPAPPPSAPPAEPAPAAPSSPPPVSAAPAPPPSPPPAPPVPAVADSRPPQQKAAPVSAPIRAVRRLSLTGELGWNGLAGIGAILSYHAHPHFSVDLGAGGSLTGWKASVRPRFNFLTSAATPFVGIGISASTGLGEVPYDPSEGPDGDPTREPVTLRINDSYFTQYVVGIDWIHSGGFTLLGCIGYARLMNHDNVEVLAGTLTPDEEQAVDALFRSGPVISIALGYSFK